MYYSRLQKGSKVMENNFDNEIMNKVIEDFENFIIVGTGENSKLDEFEGKLL